jgi:hypothetical protein
MNSKNYALLLAFLLLFSCGKKRDNSASAITFMAAVGGNPVSTGGIMVYGKNKTTNQIFALDFNHEFDTKALELPNGDWVFMALSWDDPNFIFEGVMRCDLIETNLNGGERTISFNVNGGDCLNDLFVLSDYRSGGALLDFEVKNCLVLTGLSDVEDSCGTAGNSLSYQVVSYSYILGPDGEPVETRPGLVSRCLPITSGIGVSTLSIPTGNGVKSPFAFGIRLFNQASCAGEKDLVLFKQGFGLPASSGEAHFIKNPVSVPSAVRVFTTQKSAFDLLTRDDVLAEAGSLSSGNIATETSGSQVLADNSILFFQTSSGFLGKMRFEGINTSSNEITFSYVTYNSDGTILESSFGVAVDGTFSKDLDSDSDFDLFNQVPTGVSTQITPQNSALFHVLP